jgi:outer membrane receptor protein involved in Fe transport
MGFRKKICRQAAGAILFCFFFVIINSTPARGQSSRVGASLEGTVTDSSGAVIPGAHVVARNTSTAQVREADAGDDGFFRLQALPVGTYELTAEREGFATYKNGGIEIGLGQTAHVDVTLAPASASEQITVHAQPSAIDPTQTSVVSSVDRERIEELPVQTRNYLNFTLLAPGVTNSPVTQPGGGATPLAGSGFTFGGLRSRSNNVSIDGLDNNDEYTGSSRIEISPEIVQEFQVINNGLSAESGGASGGSINVVTRSGANVVHGDAFIFAQDSALNARDPFASESGKPAFRHFREGVAVGGPIVKNRMFYYVALEQEHDRGQNDSDIDPALAAAINTALAGGAFARLATRNITTDFFPISRSEIEAAGRFDDQITKSTSLMVRYAMTNNQESGSAYNSSGLADVTARGSSYTSDNTISGSLTTVFGSGAVGDLRLQAATRRAVLKPNSAGPEIEIAGLVDFGRLYGGDTSRRETHFQGAYTYTATHRQHLWKTGAVVNRVDLRATQADGFAGIYIFRTLNDFLTGNPAQFRQAFGNPSVDFAVTSLGLFAQDHWSISRRFTADIGVRYDFERLPAQFRQDANNFSPRIGLAWNPSARWVLRAGYGIFFDRYILANLTRAVDKNGALAFDQVVDGPAAAGIFSAAQGGTLLAPVAGVAPSIFAPDPRMSTPFSQQASAGVEVLLAGNLSMRGDYLFVHGSHLPRTLNINLLPPAILTVANATSLGVVNPLPQQFGREVFSAARRNPQFDDIYQLSNSASSVYHGVSFTLNRRMNDELAFSASYTLSKTFDDASDYDEQPQSPFALAAEDALSRQHQQQRLVLNALWELPIGDEDDDPAKTTGAPDKESWITDVFSHIEVAPIFTVGSARPVNPLTGVDSGATHAFPLSARPLGFGRNSLQIPRTTVLDFRLLKYFPFGEARHLDVVAEFFNLLNHPNIAAINPIFGSGNSPIAGFGQPIEGLGSRQVQFSLDFEF